MLSPNELKEIQDVVAFLKQELDLHPEKMAIDEQEHVAAGIVGLAVNDRFGDWQKQYPKLGKIFDLASDLEWSNIGSKEDIPGYWESIIRLTNELDHEIREANAIR